MMTRLLLIGAMGLGIGVGGCTFTDPLDEVAVPRSPAERIERRERRDRAENARIVRCQTMDREDPRWDRDCKNR